MPYKTPEFSNNLHKKRRGILSHVLCSWASGIALKKRCGNKYSTPELEYRDNANISIRSWRSTKLQAEREEFVH